MVSLYPQVDPKFGIAECSHAFHVNVNSLKNTTIKSTRVRLTTLGQQCGQTATTDGEIQTFLQRLHDQWCDFTAAAGMQILSFHNSMGAVILNTTTAADPMILLPLQNGIINQCRAVDICFVRLQCIISFRDKITTAGSIYTFRYEYYVELPQTTHNLTNGNNQPYQLTTWGGVDGLCTLTGAVVRQDILAHTLQVGPAQLIAPAFASKRATLETLTARIDIEESLLRMAFDQIAATLLKALAPNFTTQPHVIIDQVRQVWMSEDGKWECMSVHDYFTQFSAATMPFNFMTIFPIDVCADGNCPAQSKHVLLKSWLIPEIVQDDVKFVGFAQFYSRWIQNFELRIMPLQAILTREYSDSIGDLWTQEAQASFDDIRNSILLDPVIKRFNHNKLCVLRSDFSSLGVGYVLLQPGSDSESIKAMDDYRAGKGFTFMTPGSLAMLHPICFGARCTRGNESRLHSHLGEGFAGDYAINKCWQYLFAQRFVWVTDCYAIKFILSYEGGNIAILHLQMRLMCWDCDIVHRPESQLVDADYWSCLGVDLEYDPLFLEYLQKTCQLRRLSPPTTSLPMLPDNMPYNRSPRITTPNLAQSSSQESDAEAHHINTLITNVASHDNQSYTHLSNVPVRFGKLSTPPASQDHQQHKLYNSEIASYALNAILFSWAVYAFSNGHFPSTILSQNLPFRITLACDVTASGRSLFGKFAPDATVFVDIGSVDLFQVHYRTVSFSPALMK
jgi:hypothetical protein